jgi:LemA protein
MTPVFQRWAALLLLITTLSLSACGYNQFQSGNEQVKASWSEVLSQYQRRADLIPNLVNVVKGQADFESGTLQAVVDARAKATAIQATPELVNDAQAFQKFQQAQRELSGSLSRLLVVAESYPTLRANQGFMELQAQLEGTENRIAVARKRYIQSVQDYNVTVHSFPSNLTAWALGYKEKPNFTVDNEQAITKPPTVTFDPKAAPAQSPSTSPSTGKTP